MTGDFYINGKDAWIHWGANMGEGFLEELLTPPPAKEYVSNKSRLSHGKQVLYSNPRFDEQDMQLTITIEGKDQAEYLERYEKFLQEVVQGEIVLGVPALKRSYRLYYTDAPVKMGNSRLQFGKFVFKFCEPDPSKRDTFTAPAQ